MNKLEYKNLWDFIYLSSLRYSNNIALIYKQKNQWKKETYKTFSQKVIKLSKGLREIGIRKGEKVAIYLPNSPEWMYFYLAVILNGGTCIPLDTKLGSTELSHILKSSEAKYLIINGKGFCEKIPTILEKSHLEYIILVGRGFAQLPQMCKFISLEKSKKISGLKRIFNHFKIKLPFTHEKKIKVIHHEELFLDAENSNIDIEESCLDDVASIIYTSGTMGIPKGVMLTHRNFIANVLQIYPIIKSIKIKPESKFLLILPLNHAYAFTANFLLPLSIGCSIVFIESYKKIIENAYETSPEVMIAVPLILEKIHKRLKKQISESKIKSFLFKFLFFKKIVGKKFKEKLGGKLIGIISGGAPLDPEICRDFNDMGIMVLQGYGMTEASPVISVNPVEKIKCESVGPPLEGIEIKISNPNSGGVGELLVKGENVMKGYYNMPEETEKVLKDGWLHTGDLAKIDEENYIYIKGRKKTIIVNREGKNIYPEEVEFILNHSAFILESLVLGYYEEGSIGEKVGAIIVPDMEYFEEYAKKNKINLTDEVIEKIIKEEVARLTENIADYKKPRKIKIQMEPFQKTPTQKIKRTLYKF